MVESTHDVDVAALLVDVLPQGLLVVDRLGTVHHANQRAATMTGYPVDVLVGRTVLDFVYEEDLEFLVQSLDHASDYPGAVMGPVRIRYRRSTGEIQWTECWAYECPPESGIVDGYVITMSTESVLDNLSKAVRDVASGAPLRVALQSAARAVQASPIEASGVVLMRAHGGFETIGTWPFGVDEFVNDLRMPWHVVGPDDARDVHVSDLPEPLRGHAERAGYHWCWIRSITADDHTVPAVFVAWRSTAGAVSPNQERHLAETVAVAQLAFSHDDRRRQLQRAALTDHLTGLSNRLDMARRLAEIGVDHFGVLYIDLDGFKEVNDEHGHDVGDAVLAITAQRIRAAVRRDDAVYRVGGDEFVVIGRGRSDREFDEFDDDGEPFDELGLIAQRLVNALSVPIGIEGHVVRIGASVGSAVRQIGEPAEHVVRRADRALLGAKRSGKSCWLSADLVDVR